MKLCSLMVIILWGTALSAQGENLLKNPGFEEEGHWEAYDAASLRNKWRSHDGGQFNAAILGMWATQGFHGYIEQANLPVEAGKRYVFRAWLWRDLGWLPREQYMMIVFFNAAGEIAGEARAELPSLHPLWTPVKCSGTAPAGAVTAAVRLGAREVSAQGALTIDDVYFGEESGQPSD